MLQSRRSRGFTIVELIVVVLVIAILAGIVVVSYNRAQALSRDTKRTADLRAIADSITAYRLRYGDQVEAASCSGGLNSTGSGWFNYTGTNYTSTILSCLTNKGYLSNAYFDPFGCADASGTAVSGYTCKRTGYAYAKTTCTVNGQSVTVLMARLELGGNVANLQGSNAVCDSATYATNYSFNYMIQVD